MFLQRIYLLGAIRGSDESLSQPAAGYVPQGSELALRV
jgi:hypothetical protein